METVKVVEFTAVIEEIELPFKLYDTVLAMSLSKLAVNVMLSPGPIKVSSPERERESSIVKIGEQGRIPSRYIVWFSIYRRGVAKVISFRVIRYTPT